MPDDREAEVISLAYWRDGQRASLMAIDIGLAVEMHPEEVRRALAQVFDISAIEESHRRLALVLAQTQAQLAEVRDSLREAREETEELRKRLHRVHEWLTTKAKAIVAGTNGHHNPRTQ